MSRETKYTAVILKKQPYKEGDEIITVFTLETGKIRCLAKAVKKPLSKLQQKLQSLFLVELTLAGRNMPKIIRVEVLKVFGKMRENLTAANLGFYAMELVLKFTPDEQKNEQLFGLLVNFLEFLDSEKPENLLNSALAKFKLEILEASGLGVNFAVPEGTTKVFFSPGKGGFFDTGFADSIVVPTKVFGNLLNIKNRDFNNLNALDNYEDNGQLQALLSQFIEYQLERKINSEKYL